MSPNSLLIRSPASTAVVLLWPTTRASCLLEISCSEN